MMVREGKEPQPIANIVAELLARRGWGEVQAARQREAAWREVVGPQLAAQTRPGALRGGKLEVWATHSAVLQELGFIKHQIIAALNARLPQTTISDLRFRVGKLG